MTTFVIIISNGKIPIDGNNVSYPEIDALLIYIDMLEEIFTKLKTFHIAIIVETMTLTYLFVFLT
jgi:hypothetical protein